MERPMESERERLPSLIFRSPLYPSLSCPSQPHDVPLAALHRVPISGEAPSAAIFSSTGPPLNPFPVSPSSPGPISHYSPYFPVSQPHGVPHSALHPASQPRLPAHCPAASLSPPFTTFSDEAPSIAYFSSTGPPLNPAFPITPPLLASNDIFVGNINA
ncbi:unnamed protein product [Closterium sp. NIES-65]|nr:unnamed protein product [Closterium sp. NIES-65]